ncbi:hypothetical protein D3C87_1918090 [compost metagenome]
MVLAAHAILIRSDADKDSVRRHLQGFVYQLDPPIETTGFPEVTGFQRPKNSFLEGGRKIFGHKTAAESQDRHADG